MWLTSTANLRSYGSQGLGKSSAGRFCVLKRPPARYDLAMAGNMDFQLLIQPVSAERPCGESLEDTPTLAMFDTYRIFGQATQIEPAPDWRALKALALQALAVSKDLRVLAHFGAAVIRTDGVTQFLQTLQIGATWLDDYWDQAHPAIDEDFLLRKNALSCFADRIAIIDAVRRAPLAVSRQFASVSMRDAELANGQLVVADEAQRPTQESINAAFAAVALDDLISTEQSVSAARGALARIETKFRDAGGPEAAPDFDALSVLLLRMQRLLREQLAARPDAPAIASGELPVDTTTAGGVAPATAPISGSIRSRQEAIRALDAVADFFRQTEPSSPVPLFVERAKRLVSKNFIEVLAEIVPDAVGPAKAASGIRDSG